MSKDKSIMRVDTGEYPIQYPMLKPSNSYGHCILYILDKKGKLMGAKNWQPSTNDLIADDWEVID